MAFINSASLFYSSQKDSNDVNSNIFDDGLVNTCHVDTWAQRKLKHWFVAHFLYKWDIKGFGNYTFSEHTLNT